jgi:hypothetical protein
MNSRRGDDRAFSVAPDNHGDRIEPDATVSHTAIILGAIVIIGVAWLAVLFVVVGAMANDARGGPAPRPRVRRAPPAPATARPARTAPGAAPRPARPAW